MVRYIVESLLDMHEIKYLTIIEIILKIYIEVHSIHVHIHIPCALTFLYSVVCLNLFVKGF